MEKDGEAWSGSAGNQLDFGARIYDSRLGKWFATDPLEAKYPWSSPYSFVANKPTLFIDIDGRDIEFLGSAKALVKPIIDQIRTNSVMFDIVITQLEQSDNLYKIGFGKEFSDVEVPRKYKANGWFSPSNNRIELRNDKLDVMTIIEELSHAFQFDFYGTVSDDVSQDYGVTFIESEVKLIRYLIANEAGVFPYAISGDNELVLTFDFELTEGLANSTFYHDNGTSGDFDKFFEGFKKRHLNDGSNYSSSSNFNKEPAAFNYLQIETKRKRDENSDKNKKNKPTKPNKPTYNGKVPKKNR